MEEMSHFLHTVLQSSICMFFSGLKFVAISTKILKSHFNFNNYCHKF